jgi:hypothetical protein
VIPQEVELSSSRKTLPANMTTQMEVIKLEVVSWEATNSQQMVLSGTAAQFSKRPRRSSNAAVHTYITLMAHRRNLNYLALIELLVSCRTSFERMLKSVGTTLRSIKSLST